MNVENLRIACIHVINGERPGEPDENGDIICDDCLGKMEKHGERSIVDDLHTICKQHQEELIRRSRAM